MKKINQLVACAAILALASFMAGCQNAEQNRDERAESAARHFEGAKSREIIEGKKLSLSESVSMAAGKSLSAKLNKLEERIASERRTAETLGALPQLDNVKDNGMDAGVACSVIDFSLAFLNEKQAQDANYLSEQRRNRAAQNLAFDVVKAYYATAAAQRAAEITKVRLKQAGDPDQFKDKVTSAQYLKFAALKKQLSEYLRMKEVNSVELCKLIGAVPTEKVAVDANCLNKLPAFMFPDVKVLEQIALLMRPELYEIGLSKQINIFQLRNEMKSLFPQIGAYVDFMNSDIYNMNWWAFGIRSAYNLLSVAVDMNKAWNAEEKRGIAQAFAIVAQVRIAHADLVACKKVYDENVKAGKEAEKIIALGNYYTACYRLINVLGLKTVGAPNVAVIVDEVAAAQKRAETEISSADREVKEIAAAKAKAVVSGANTVETRVVNQSLTDFGAVDLFSVYDTTPARAAQAGKGGK